MGRERIEGGEFSVGGGYVFYKRLIGDSWTTRFLGVDVSVPALESLTAQQKEYDNHTWKMVAKQLELTGYAEQEKERRFLSVLGNNNFNQQINYKDYPAYIEAINQLIGLKKYKDYLKEVKAQAEDTSNRRAAGGFRYFESRLATAINQGIKESMSNLTPDMLMSMTPEQIKGYVENSISESIERAMEKIGNSKPAYISKQVKIWKEINDGFKKLNSTNKNFFTQKVMDMYHLNDIAPQITDWLENNFQNPRKKSDLFWGLGKQIKSAININEPNAPRIEGSLSEFIPMLININKGAAGAVFASDRFKTDSVELFKFTASVNVDDLIERATYLDPGDTSNKEIVKRFDTFTREVLDKIDEGFVVYDSSKMYRLSGSFSGRGFHGTSGNLENLGAAMAQFGGNGQLNTTIAHVLYQTMQGAILDGARDTLIEQVKKEIISCITTAFFDDISFQGVNSVNDNVIHMLTLDAIRVPLSFYCLALSQAIGMAVDDSSLLKDYVSISISVPKKILYEEKINEETVPGKFPGRIYTAWNNQSQAAINGSHFHISFLRNFEDIIDGLIKGQF